MNKKLKKLIKNPRLYFADLLNKRLAKGAISIRHLPWVKKVSGNHKYSVVCAVYGVESYIEQFFTSIENQTLDFVEHIELIMVDDGSLDSSADIIKKWISKYPQNIKYINKENGGQASARNLGMTHVSNEWVTFIDPDDFVDNNYFSEVDAFISTEEDMALVSSNFIFYYEDEDKFSDTHVLKYRYHADETIFDADDLKNHIQLSASAAFFKTQIIVKNNLIMETNIKPSFEDAHFVGKYLLSIFGMKVGFLKSAKYYYRKREDNSSTLDGAWFKPLLYSDKLEYGSLGLLEYAEQKLGKIPNYIQRTVLYDYIWYVKYIVNNKVRLSFLDKQQKDDFFKLSKLIFLKIDYDIINEFNLAGSWFYHKVGMLGLFKDASPKSQIIYIDGFDLRKDLLKVRYFYYGDKPLELFTLDGVDTVPIYQKIRGHDFLDKNFVNERIAWLSIEEPLQILRVVIDGIDSPISFSGRQYVNGFPIELEINKSTIRKSRAFIQSSVPKNSINLREKSQSALVKEKYSNAWLLMDRDVQADDNAEHLFRYILQNHPGVNAFFVLRKDSHDWQRLLDDGFNLIEFDSVDHKLALLNADHFISSHADDYVTNYLPKNYFGDLLKYKFTFLQHGVTKDDLSDWLNFKPIELFVTATKQEYSSISGDGNHYKYSKKEVLLSGFPRHDALLALNKEIATEKILLIMPTWRNNLAGKAIGKGHKREINLDFYDSDFAINWKSILHSKKLKSLIEEYSYQVLFFPHANIQPYLSWFETPDYIKTISHADVGSMQKLFCRAALMVTDYSSVAFEMAYLGKSIIYYQFDHDDVFSGAHLAKGYYEYEDDGFGKVCYEKNQLIEEVEVLLDNKGLPSKKYYDRMEETFEYRDGLCCKRVFDGIERLNSTEYYNSQNCQLSTEFAEKAADDKSWELSASRWELIYANAVSNSNMLFEAGLQAAGANRCDGKIGSAKIWLDCLTKACSESIDAESYWKIKREWAHLWMASQEWEKALECLNEVVPNFDAQARVNLIFSKIECLGYLNRWNELKKEVIVLRKAHLSDLEQSLALGWKHIADHKWDIATEAWEAVAVSDRSLIYYHAQLFVSCMKKSYSETIDSLETIKTLTNNSRPVLLDARVGIGKEAYISFANKWGMDFDEMPAIDMFQLIRALRENNQLEEAKKLLEKALRLFPNDKNILIESAELSLVDGDIEGSTKQWELLFDSFGDGFIAYKLAYVYQQRGLIDKAASLLFHESKSILVKPKTNSDWVLLSQLANQTGNEIALRDFSCAE